MNGQRIKKVSGGGTTTNYRYASGLLICQTNGTHNLYFRYDSNGMPRAVKYNNTDYYYLYNLQGDVVTIYDAGGNAVVNYKYDSWGKLIATTGSLASTLGVYNPFRYRGYVYDTETGFYYLNSRYYDPETGRFINADGYITTGTGITSYTMFVYCSDNPVILMDSCGDREMIAIIPAKETKEERAQSFEARQKISTPVTRTPQPVATHPVVGIGFAGNGSFVASGSVSGEIVTDFQEKESAIIGGWAVGGGLCNLSGGVSISVYNVPSVDKLRGGGVPVSISIGPVGYQLTLLLDEETNRIYLGHTITLSKNIGAPLNYTGEYGRTYMPIKWDWGGWF